MVCSLCNLNWYQVYGDDCLCLICSVKVFIDNNPDPSDEKYKYRFIVNQFKDRIEMKWMLVSINRSAKGKLDGERIYKHGDRIITLYGQRLK